MPAPGTAPAPADLGSQPRVLLIRPTALGDVCRTVPALVTLRRALPKARIEWLVNDTFTDAIAHHPALDGLIGFPRARFASWAVNPRIGVELLGWLNDLRRRRYDLVVDLQGLMRSGLFAWVTGAGRRLGYARARELGWLGYNRRHDIPPGHAVDRMLALLAADGFDPVYDLRLYLGPHEQAWLTRFLNDNGLVEEPYFALGPTARWLCKCWPLDGYAQVVQRLAADGRAGRKVVLIASPAERTQLQPLINALGGKVPLIFPTTSVGQMMALVSRASMLICNDSAPMHVAVGFDRPLVSIFGPTDPHLEGPCRRMDTVVEPAELVGVRREGYRWNREDQSLIGKVTVEQVWEKVLEQLERGKPNSGQ